MLPIKEEKILHQAKKVAMLISDQEEVKTYQIAEQKIKDHQRIQELINLIKLKQQELVNAKAIKTPNYIKQVEEQLDRLNEELHGIPLVDQYQQYQKELNQYLHSIVQLIKDELGRTIVFEEE